MRVAIELLLVEDETLIQDLLETVLSDTGFKVVTADNGMRALAQLETDPARFGAVITDINLGGRGPDGWKVARRARELVSNMPLVYMTGGNTHEWSANGLAGSVLLSKPFTLSHFVTVVSTLLSGAAAPQTLRHGRPSSRAKLFASTPRLPVV
jgi:DNA-binding response OmpR family regulator